MDSFSGVTITFCSRLFGFCSLVIIDLVLNFSKVSEVHFSLLIIRVSLSELVVFFHLLAVVGCSPSVNDSLLVCSSTIITVKKLRGLVVSSSGFDHSNLCGTDLYSYISVTMDIGILVRLVFFNKNTIYYIVFFFRVFE